ncbi:hypothetical protein KC346_g79, partial [Hortaea werneckii]
MNFILPTLPLHFSPLPISHVQSHTSSHLQPPSTSPTPPFLPLKTPQPASTDPFTPPPTPRQTTPLLPL